MVLLKSILVGFFRQSVVPPVLSGTIDVICGYRGEQYHWTDVSAFLFFLRYCNSILN